MQRALTDPVIYQDGQTGGRVQWIELREWPKQACTATCTFGFLLACTRCHIDGYRHYYLLSPLVRGKSVWKQEIEDEHRARTKPRTHRYSYLFPFLSFPFLSFFPTIDRTCNHLSSQYMCLCLFYFIFFKNHFYFIYSLRSYKNVILIFRGIK